MEFDVFLLNYSVKGIKNLSDWARFYFYKNTINPNDLSFDNYRVKAVYGANGSGKSAVMSSVKVLRSLLSDPLYLVNPINQKELNELVNKKTEKLEIDVEFLCKKVKAKIYRYQIVLAKNNLNRFYIAEELFTSRPASSHNTKGKVVYKINNGEIEILHTSNPNLIMEATRNLLSNQSFVSTFMELLQKSIKLEDSLISFIIDLLYLVCFGLRLNVYMDTEDDHSDYYLDAIYEGKASQAEWNDFIKNISLHDNSESLHISLQTKESFVIDPRKMKVSKAEYNSYEETIKSLCSFVKIFKKNLKNIEIDKKEVKSYYICELVMDYGDYKINSEFESTGIKKLIKLYSYFQKMMDGEVVFIDELDSNLHDVYLCALLEYLMENGKGQLCFTTHNIGPMDVLKHSKKSIDFLSVDHTVYSWSANGNYSPANLYRKGMIEGSPFNIDSFDFVGVFTPDEG